MTDSRDLEITIQLDTKQFEDAMKPRSPMTDFSKALADFNELIDAGAESMEKLKEWAKASSESSR